MEAADTYTNINEGKNQRKGSYPSQLERKRGFGWKAKIIVQHNIAQYESIRLTFSWCWHKKSLLKNSVAKVGSTGVLEGVTYDLLQYALASDCIFT